MSLIVQKYGGTSLATIAHVKSIAAHIAHTVGKGHKVVAVVSAMGNQTDDLITLARQVSRKPPPRELDMLLTVGERISMSLLSIALHDLSVASVSFTGSQSGILTDDCHGNARIQKVLGDRLREGLQKLNVVIVAGFQGMSAGSKEITTLGRGGTDLTATAIAHTLKADSCQIYKDVDGICTADPSVVPSARLIKDLGWRALLDLTWSGAGVLHARAAHLALKYRIPLEIRSSLHLDRPGTRIHGVTPMESVSFTSLTSKKDQTLLSVTLPAEPTLLAKGLKWLWAKGETPLVNQHVAHDGMMTIQQLLDAQLVDDYVAHLETLSAKGKVRTTRAAEDLTAISVVGEGFWQSPETVERILEVAGQTPRYVDARNTVVTLGVEGDGDEILRRLHQTFFERKT